MTPAASGPTMPPEKAPPPQASDPAPQFAVIVAVAANGVIGDGNRLPWRLPADLRHFRALTTGHAIIMGRRTWESLPGALPGRQSIVVSRDASYAAAGADVVTSLEDALRAVRMPAPAFCIGGGELYRAALPKATTLYLTEIHREYPGDVFFPPPDPEVWRETGREEHGSEDPAAPSYAFVTYQHITPSTRNR